MCPKGISSAHTLSKREIKPQIKKDTTKTKASEEKRNRRKKNNGTTCDCHELSGSKTDRQTDRRAEGKERESDREGDRERGPETVGWTDR